jgi:hypothetical protein
MPSPFRLHPAVCMAIRAAGEPLPRALQAVVCMMVGIPGVLLGPLQAVVCPQEAGPLETVVCMRGDT